MVASTGTRRLEESRSSCSWGSRTSLDGATSTGSSGTDGRMWRSRSNSLACFRWSVSNGASNTQPSKVRAGRACHIVGRLARRTILVTVLLLLHMQPIGRLAAVAREGTVSGVDVHALQRQLVGDAGAALLALLVNVTFV